MLLQFCRALDCGGLNRIHELEFSWVRSLELTDVCVQEGKCTAGRHNHWSQITLSCLLQCCSAADWRKAGDQSCDVAPVTNTQECLNWDDRYLQIRGAATVPIVTDMRMTIPAISILRITIMATDGSATGPNRDFFLPLMSQTEISNIRDMSELPRDQSVKDNPDNCKELRI